MSARARHLTLVIALLVAVATPLAVAAAPQGPSGPGYTVRTGDTITSIAVRLRLPGGWPELYAANRDRIGDDPDRLRVGTRLTVPTGALPATTGYVVQPGDTLAAIAARMHVAGGGSALYAANRAVIGPDPNRLEVGQTLVQPGTPPPPPSASTRPRTAPSATGTAAPAVPSAGVVAAPAVAPETSGSSRAHLVLATAAGALVFFLLVVLAVLLLSRRRRTTTVLVGGRYSAERRGAHDGTNGGTNDSPAHESATPAPAVPFASGYSAGAVRSDSRPAEQRRSAPPSATATPAPAPDDTGDVRLVDPSTPLTPKSPRTSD